MKNMISMNQGFGTWQFSDEAVPKVEAFIAQCRQSEDCDQPVESIDPRYMLFTFAHHSLPPVRRQPTPKIESDYDSDDEHEKSNQVLPSNKDKVPLTETVDLTSDHESQQYNDKFEVCQETPQQEPVVHESHFDESSLLPDSQGLEVHDSEEVTNSDGLAELIELLESDPTEVDLSTLPNKVVIEIFKGLSDKGLSHAVDAVCSMKPTDQARFSSVIVAHLLLPRLQQSTVRCTRQVISAFSKFISCCPVLSSQHLIAPLIISVPAQHVDTVQHLIKEIKNQQQKELILRYVLEGLSSPSEPHLPLLCLLIGPSANNNVKQQLIKVLAESVDKFPNSIHFGKLLLAVVPLVQVHPELKEKLIDIVNCHQSVVKNTVLVRLSAA